MASYVLDVPESLLEACERFAALMGWVGGQDSADLSHARVEDEITKQIRAVAKLAYQGHLDLRAEHEQRLPEAIDADGVARTRAEYGRQRLLTTVFGEVTVERIAYREQGHPDLHPADAHLNLPVGRHSHGLGRLAAIEATRGSFAQAGDAIVRATGQRVGKRQIEALTVQAAVDIDAFYQARRPDPADPRLALGMSADGKGIVMRPEALREATAKTAGKQPADGLSASKKTGRKRMAEVVSVFDVDPAPRTIDDILPAPATKPHPGPAISGKWLAASVEHPTAHMITRMLGEAQRRDPNHHRVWFCIVDGNTHQIDRINAESQTRGVQVTILIDIIHVLGYLWDAAWCLYPRGDPGAQIWVNYQARGILDGRVEETIADLTGLATTVEAGQRAGLDKAITYLSNHARYLDYPSALSSGWPVASGLIEGACRWLVADRLDITGARWGLAGAEAVLKLRALISNGDFDDYWTWHLDQEQQRIHRSRYANNLIPAP